MIEADRPTVAERYATDAARLFDEQQPLNRPKLAILNTQYKCALTKQPLLVTSSG